MTDAGAVFWKEWRELFEQFGSYRRGGLAMLMLVLMFGVILPWQMGTFWLDSPMMLGYWPVAGASLVINVIVDAFAGERERHTLETMLASPLSDRGILLGKWSAAVSHGVALVLVNLLIGLVTVNLAHGHGQLLLWGGVRLLQILVLTVLGAAFVAGVGVFVSLRAATVRQAHQTFGIALVVLFLTPTILLSVLPAEVQDRVGAWARHVSVERTGWRITFVLVVVDALALLAAMRRFRRGRLTLD